MPPSHLRVEHSPAGYRRLLLSRPERRNALDVGLARALRDALGQDRAAPVVLGSADPRVFCAGADLTIPDADRATVSDLLYECYEVMITRPGPVIAVVSGPAVGGGAQLAAAADLRIAGPGARLGRAGPGRPAVAWPWGRGC
jgi:enoyl-CoA hydratase/carnithine racemase